MANYQSTYSTLARTSLGAIVALSTVLVPPVGIAAAAPGSDQGDNGNHGQGNNSDNGNHGQGNNGHGPGNGGGDPGGGDPGGGDPGGGGGDPGGGDPGGGDPGGGGGPGDPGDPGDPAMSTVSSDMLLCIGADNLQSSCPVGLLP